MRLLLLLLVLEVGEVNDGVALRANRRIVAITTLTPSSRREPWRRSRAVDWTAAAGSSTRSSSGAWPRVQREAHTAALRRPTDPEKGGLPDARD